MMCKDNYSVITSKFYNRGYKDVITEFWDTVLIRL